jgi:hypothetical protein
LTVSSHHPCSQASVFCTLKAGTTIFKRATAAAASPQKLLLVFNTSQPAALGMNEEELKANKQVTE